MKLVSTKITRDRNSVGYQSATVHTVTAAGGRYVPGRGTGNEPSLELLWEYDYIGQPYRTQVVPETGDADRDGQAER